MSTLRAQPDPLTRAPTRKATTREGPELTSRPPGGPVGPLPGTLPSRKPPLTLSSLISLACAWTSHQWDHAAQTLLCPPSLVPRDFGEIHSCCQMQGLAVFTAGQNSIHNVCIQLLEVDCPVWGPQGELRP